jgi:hypothetical protein
MTIHDTTSPHAPLGAICWRKLRAVFMGVRQRLPNRRASTSITFEMNGLAYTVTYSRFLGGGLAEVFLQNHRPGSGADVNAHDSAIAASFALQCAARAEDIRRALCRDSFGRPLGPLGCALDLIAGEGDSP